MLQNVLCFLQKFKHRTLNFVLSVLFVFTFVYSLLQAKTVTDDKKNISENGLIATDQPCWPQWRGPYRDGKSSEKGLLQSWPAEGPKLLWQIEELGRGWSSPIIVNGMLYVTGDVERDLVIYAYDIDGNFKWKVTNGASWRKSYPGARACCAWSDGRLYHMNAHGRVACLDAMDGSEIWAVSILDRFDGKNITWALSECLLIDGNHVIVTPGGKRALMAALDKNTGETVWQSEPLIGDNTSHCSPILFRLGKRRILANCSSGHGFGVDADTGKLLWTVPLKNKYGTNVATPVFGHGAIYFVTPYAELGRQYRLRIDGSRILADHIWTSHLDTVTGSGVLVDGILYTAGYRKPKWWFGVDWQTGRNRFELKDLTTGSAIHADGRLYILDEKRNVALVQPGRDKPVIRGRFELPVKGKYNDAWAHPVLLNGRLYLRFHHWLGCYDVKQK